MLNGRAFSRPPQGVAGRKFLPPLAQRALPGHDTVGAKEKDTGRSAGHEVQLSTTLNGSAVAAARAQARDQSPRGPRSALSSRRDPLLCASWRQAVTVLCTRADWCCAMPAGHPRPPDPDPSRAYDRRPLPGSGFPWRWAPSLPAPLTLPSALAPPSVLSPLLPLPTASPTAAPPVTNRQCSPRSPCTTAGGSRMSAPPPPPGH